MSVTSGKVGTVKIQQYSIKQSYVHDLWKNLNLPEWSKISRERTFKADAVETCITLPEKWKSILVLHIKEYQRKS